MIPACNLCGCSEFIDMGARRKVRCAQCFSLERTRAIGLLVKRLDVIRPGARVLHLAPEQGLTRMILAVPGVVYAARDLHPGRFPFHLVEKMDLATDAEQLAAESYDVIIHSHVLEHVFANYTAVLWHLHRALRKDGVHLFCVPIFRGRYQENLTRLDPAERLAAFGQNDHARRFGLDDLDRTLGMVFRLPEDYDLADWFSEEELEAANIPRTERRGFHGSTVFMFRKDDLLLV